MSDKRSSIEIGHPEDSRFGLALDLLEEGHPVRLRGLRLALTYDALEVEVPTVQEPPRPLDGITTDREYEAAREILRSTADSSPRFQLLLNRVPVALALVVDYGYGAFEVSRLDRDFSLSR